MQNFLFSLHCLSTTFTQSCLSAVVNCLALCWAEIHMLCLLQLAAVPHDRNEVIVKLIWGSKAFRMLGGVNKMIFSLGGVVRYFFWKVYYLQSLSLMLISHHFSSAFIREVLSADCSSCHSLHNVFFLGFFPLRVFVFLMDLHCKTFFCILWKCVFFAQQNQVADLVCKTSLKVALLPGQMGVSLFIWRLVYESYQLRNWPWICKLSCTFISLYFKQVIFSIAIIFSFSFFSF